MKQVNTTSRIITVAAFVVLALAAMILTYLFAHQYGYNAGRAVGRIEGAEAQAKKDATDKDEKNWDINQHIWDAYAQGCQYAATDIITTLGYSTIEHDAEIQAACERGNKVLPFYNL